MKKFLVAAAFTLLPMGALAQDFNKGLAASEAGDYATALEEWLPLAEQGDAAVQAAVGYIYFNGTRDVRDYGQAVHWLRLAVEQDSARAGTYLAVLYQRGKGVPKSDREAFGLLTFSAKLGDDFGQMLLGVAYEYGRGIPQDFVAAHQWYNIASANGSSAGEARDTLASRMTAEDISEAQRRARICMASNYQDCD